MVGSALRALANGLTFANNWTEKDFTPAELTEYRRAYQNSQRRLNTRGGKGGIQYGDYSNTLTYSNTPLSEFPKRLMQTNYNVTNTLGRANYFTDKDGNIIIADTWDFNSSSTPKGNRLSDIVRRDFIEPNAKSFDVIINLGNPNDWTSKDLGINL